MNGKRFKKLILGGMLLFSACAIAQTRTDNLVKDAADLYRAQNYSGVLRLLENEDSTDYRINYLQIIAKYELLKDYRSVIENARAEAQDYVRRFGSKNSKYTADIKNIASNLDFGAPVATVESAKTVAVEEEKFPPITFATDYPDFQKFNHKLIQIGSPDYSLAENPKELSEKMNAYFQRYGENFFKGKANFCLYYEIGYENVSKKGKRLMLDMRTGKVYDVPDAGNRCTDYDSDEKEFDNDSNYYIVKSCEGGQDEYELTYAWSEDSKKFNLVEKKLINE